MRPVITAVTTGVLLCPAALAAQPGSTLEELLVTAQHREESAQSTPISLLSINAEQLEKARITSIADLNGFVPNLNIDSFPANNQTLRLFIRGVGLTDTQLTQDAAVGVYLNGAYMARSTGLALDLVDLDRIEVLRGPQGTLYGRNTTAGAIKLISKKPDTDNLQLRQTVSVGNQDLRGSKTVANLPLGDNIAAKLAYLYQEVRGFTKNHGPGGNWGDRESHGWRLDLRALLGDDLTLNYSFDRSDVRSFNLPAQAVTPRESGSGLLAIVGGIAQPYIRYDSERISTLNTTAPLLPTDTDIQGHTINVEWAINEDTLLRSISAWRELSDQSYLDFASGATAGFRIDFNAAVLGVDAGSERLDLRATRPDLQQEQYSQEFHLLGNLGDATQYLTGLYFFHEEAEEEAAPTRHIFSASPFAGGTLYNLGTEYNAIENDAWAFFSQLTWTPDILGRRLHLTVGWRHSEDSRDALREVTDAVVVDQGASLLELLPATSFAADAGDDYSDDSFTFIAEYGWQDTLNLYAKYAEAYKSGGFNTRDSEEDGFRDGFVEEKLRSVEAGFKGEWLHRRLRLNAALFHQRFTDFQYNFQIPGTIQNTRVFNIDEGEMTGLELELTAVPLPGLSTHVNYAYTDSQLDDVIDPFTGETRKTQFTNAPEHTLSMVADYRFPGIARGELNLNVSYNFVDSRQPDSATIYRDAYDLINARLSLSRLEALGGEWTIAVWGKNLQDTDYESFTLDNLPHAERAVIWGDARTFGLDLTYRYQ